MDDYPYLVRSTSDLPQHIRDRALQSIDPDEPRVSIYCAADSHRTRPWFVASFKRDNDGHWAMSMNYPMRGGLAFWVGNTFTTGLVGDRAVDEGDALAPYDPAFRSRYALECGACGFKRTARSDGALQAVCDTLWAVNVRELPLAVFAARLTKPKC